ncbi:hypothetical protein ACJJH9_00115 (plasmid) [Microbulbifer sp. DLAB2-AF]|uniref:hypothetical protein n=1 Tax=Microbulbifer sp. DLAB2-AF TaxID=3243395 RepID=UPI00403A4D5B
MKNLLWVLMFISCFSFAEEMAPEGAWKCFLIEEEKFVLPEKGVFRKPVTTTFYNASDLSRVKVKIYEQVLVWGGKQYVGWKSRYESANSDGTRYKLDIMAKNLPIYACYLEPPYNGTLKFKRIPEIALKYSEIKNKK